MKAADLWNLYEQSGTIVNNKLIPSETIKIKGKDVWYIEKNDGKYTVHLIEPNTCKHLNYSIYGTPEESLTLKFAMANRKRFGVIPYITDKDYVVNSYHVDPREHIDAFTKLAIEGKYLALSSGGAVSYVEMPDLTKNKKAVLNIIQYMHDHIIYSEFNRRLGICYKCGHEGDVDMIHTEDGNFVFKCPVCGNTDDSLMDITARICGYLGKVTAGNTNKGRLYDIFSRTEHLDCKDENYLEK